MRGWAAGGGELAAGGCGGRGGAGRGGAWGRGVAGRREVAVEVEPAWRGRGVGRSALAATRHLVPDGEPLWAQISPGNVASVRAFLAAGFVPVGAEALLVPW